jgi:L-alanine-DL-glutamate epimerase-like enolase superfamily enzyme
VENHAVDILQPNCCFNGGYTETRKAAHHAQIYNLTIANGGGWPLFNMHTMAGMMNGWYVEWHLGIVQIGETFFKNAPVPENGEITLSEQPGLGLTVDYDNVRVTKKVPA